MRHVDAPRDSSVVSARNADDGRARAADEKSRRPKASNLIHGGTGNRSPRDEDYNGRFRQCVHARSKEHPRQIRTVIYFLIESPSRRRTTTMTTARTGRLLSRESRERAGRRDGTFRAAKRYRSVVTVVNAVEYNEIR